MQTKILGYNDLGFIDYKKGWELQKATLELRHQEKVPDILFLLEHPSAYTLGKIADKNNLIGSEDFLSEHNIAVYHIDRGGDITYHGPGQVVGYPIINLNFWKKDTHKYLRALEEVIIRTCSNYKINAERNTDYTGVWIKDRKIAAIGIKVSRWITMHGFAFNVNTDLSFFTGIVPCGIKNKQVTSLQKEISQEISIPEVKKTLLKNFKEVFSYTEVRVLSKEELLTAEINN